MSMALYVHGYGYIYGLSFITFRNWIMSSPCLKSGSTGKYQHSVSGIPSTSCWYFPVLPSSRQGTDTILHSTLQLSTIEPFTIQISQYSFIQYNILQ